jgi:hypothetical protein
MVKLYSYFPMCVHGVVLSSLSTETILPLPLWKRLFQIYCYELQNPHEENDIVFWFYFEFQVFTTVIM